MTAFEDYISHLQRFGIQPGLERIQALLECFGQPHRKYPHVLVGGTNGKGSTCEFLARMLATDGANIGLYTSPHLYRWNERIRIVQSSQRQVKNSFADAICDSDLDTLFHDAKPHLEAVAAELGQPTEFETITALALWHFARRGVEAAVLEVGLGGKWDATNAADPLVSVITHVALDHCDRLGNTLEEIARDKVQIARAGRLLVTNETKINVLRVLNEECQTIGAQLKHASELAPRMGNDFQSENLQSAQAAFIAFNAARGLKKALPTIELNVPGRLQIVREAPRVVLDVCNNPDGAAHLAQALPALLKPEGRLILVLGILADKDFAAMTSLLAPLAQVVIATQSQSPRAAEASAIAQIAKQHCAHVETITTVPAALERALRLAATNDAVCVAGSFTTIGEITMAT
jgi:dihydrofolate synthase / folylpolyglutamate synthase